MRRAYLVPLVFLITVPTLLAQPTPAVRFPETPAGRTAAAFFRAFNDDDSTALRSYLETSIAAGALKRTPVSERFARLSAFRREAHALRPLRVLDAGSSSLRVLVRTGSGETLSMEFQLEADPPYGQIGLRIEPAESDAASGDRKKNDAALVTAIGEYLRAESAADRFSGVVLVAKRGTPIFQEAYGMANKEQGIPNTPETRFNLGSINKSFTAVTIEQLAAEGKLSFDDTIGKFLPNYPNKEAAATVTVGQLLSMRSGIGDFFGERFRSADRTKILSIKDYLPLFADKPLLFKPGTSTRYSNGGYVVLGAIIEAVTGQDYYGYVTKHLFIPAGMTHSGWFCKDSLGADVAVGYTRPDSARGEPWRVNDDFLPGRGSSAGGGYSTAGDLLQYTKALGNPSIVPPTFEGSKGLGIAGGTAGVNAALEYDTFSGYAIIVLSNYDPPAAERVARKIRSWLPAR